MPNLSNTLLDNSCDELKIVNVIKTCLQEKECFEIRIATGYWDIKALALVCKELKTFLQKPEASLKFLIGTDPSIRAELIKDENFHGKFPSDYLLRDLSSIKVIEEYEEPMKLLIDYCLEDETKSKIKVRLFKKNSAGDSQFLHAKCYVFSGEKNYGCGIIGSSNFTQKGLEDNAELNYIERQNAVIYAVPNQNSDVKGHKYWFDEQWEVAEEWNRQFRIDGFSKSSVAKKIIQIRKQNESVITPYEAYIKLLQSKFSYIVDSGLSDEIESFLPKSYESYSYQINAVKQCFAIMNEHHGFILGDVVGLGKTIVGILIIKKFIYGCELENKVSDKVLIITPPAIKSAWKKTIADFDRDSNQKIADYIDFITTGKIDSLLDDFTSDDYDLFDTGNFEEKLNSKKDYGLIIIDESHKFRNADTQMYKSLDELIRKIGERVGYPYVGLLSATPQNNKPRDLQNQIYLFERERSKSTLKETSGGNLESFFSRINKDYDSCIKAKKPGNVDEITFKNEQQQKLSKICADVRNGVLQHLVVRRTRTDIKLHYQDVIKEQNLIFPEIKGPLELKYALRGNLPQLFLDTIDAICSRDEEASSENMHLHFYRYRSVEFLKNPANRIKHEERKNLDAERFSKQLAKMVQINLVKRLESSISAFRSSLQHLIQDTQNLISMLEKDVFFICPDINLSEEFDRKKKSDKYHKVYTFFDCCNDVRKKIQKLDKEGKNEKKRNCEYKAADFDDAFLDGLRTDLYILESLNKRWQNISLDPKLAVFSQYLTPTLFNEDTNPQKKLVIFTESVVTAQAIEEAIKNQVDGSEYNVLSVRSSNRKDLEKVIQENFDANYVGEQKDDIQILITTDVLAEGINLHRASSILNYDTPWNSTKLMQRIGRVNRIGSKSRFIYVYNFMPSAQGDEEIKLVQKAYTKIQAFHSLFGEDSKIFSLDETVVHHDLTMQFDGCESPQEKYIHELRQYKNEFPERYNYLEKLDHGFNFVLKKISSQRLFYVMTSNVNGKFVLEKDGICSSLSTYEALDMVKKEINNEEVPLPQLSNFKLANDAYENVFEYIRNTMNKLSNKRSKDSDIVEAQSIMIEKIINSKEAKDGLDVWKKVDKALRNGNYDIAKKIKTDYYRFKDEQKSGEFQVMPLSFGEFLRNLEATLLKLLNKHAEQKPDFKVLVSLDI